MPRENKYPMPEELGRETWMTVREGRERFQLTSDDGLLDMLRKHAEELPGEKDKLKRATIVNFIRIVRIEILRRMWEGR